MTSEDRGEEASGEEAPKPPILPPSAGTVALVIDDLGRSVRDVEILVELGIPLTYAVLPYESRTPEVVAELRRRGLEIFLHLPMEADGGANPGPGALLLAMSPGELRQATRRAIDAVPGAVGVNNHMGSGISARTAAIRPVLEIVSERGLGFLDSRTSPQTVADHEALQLGILAGERDVFLDVELDPLFIREQFARLLELARERGRAIAIAHPHPLTLETLAELVPAARREGVEFVTAGKLLARTPPEGSG